MQNRHPGIPLLALLFLTLPTFAQQPDSWHDMSPHTVQLVQVDKDVKLEVLDWGGSGRPLVLLAGLGNTAHVFDDFAPKLTGHYHVYGITRHGYGASSVPPSVYEADRLGDDVLAVFDALKLDKPVLVGHSIAGEELSSVGSRHPEKVAALIYLDAVNPYSYYYRDVARVTIDLNVLQSELDQLKPGKEPSDPTQLIEELVQKSLPDFEKDLKEMQRYHDASPQKPVQGPAPTADDLASFRTFYEWCKRVNSVCGTESDLRQTYDLRPDGGVGKVRPAPAAAILAGEQKYAAIDVPFWRFMPTPRTQDRIRITLPMSERQSRRFKRTILKR